MKTTRHEPKIASDIFEFERISNMEHIPVSSYYNAQFRQLFLVYHGKMARFWFEIWRHRNQFTLYLPTLKTDLRVPYEMVVS